jgi:hypothetical protein
MGVDVILERQQKPYMTAALFQQSVPTVLIPFINRVWTNDQLAGKPAILLMENCSIHTRPEVQRMLREHDVKVITVPPHTTQIFQALDLSLFGVLKRKLQYKLPIGNDDRVVGFIQKAFHSLKQTSTDQFNFHGLFSMFDCIHQIENFSGIHQTHDFGVHLLETRPNVKKRMANAAEPSLGKSKRRVVIPWFLDRGTQGTMFDCPIEVRIAVESANLSVISIEALNHLLFSESLWVKSEGIGGYRNTAS